MSTQQVFDPEEILRRAAEKHEAQIRRAEAQQEAENREREWTEKTNHLSAWPEADGHQELVERIAEVLKFILAGRELPAVDARDNSERFAFHLYECIARNECPEAVRLLDQTSKQRHFYLEVLASLCNYLPWEVRGAIRKQEAGIRDGYCYNGPVTVPYAIILAMYELLNLCRLSQENDPNLWNDRERVAEAEKSYNRLRQQLEYLCEQADPKQWETLHAWQLVQQFIERLKDCPKEYPWRLRWRWLNQHRCFAGLRNDDAFGVLEEVLVMERCLRGELPAAAALPSLPPGSSTPSQDPLSGDGNSSDSSPIKRGRRGRRADPTIDPKADARIYDAWMSKAYKTYDDLARTLKKPNREVKIAIDRHRKRQERKDKTAPD